ncbi:leucine-rich repeat-containing G-protein coupled receptor 5-like [Sarcophilus harrisii]
MKECYSQGEEPKPLPRVPEDIELEEDTEEQKVDCSGLGLRGIPANLSVFTSYLDLNYNNLNAFPTAIRTLSSLKESLLEMPYAYQCCASGTCENLHKISNQWNKGDNISVDQFHKKDVAMLHFQGLSGKKGGK